MRLRLRSWLMLRLLDWLLQLLMLLLKVRLWLSPPDSGCLPLPQSGSLLLLQMQPRLRPWLLLLLLLLCKVIQPQKRACSRNPGYWASPPRK